MIGRIRKLRNTSALVAMGLAVTSLVAQTPRQSTSKAKANEGPSIEMANVLFRYSDSVSVLVSGLHGRLEPTVKHPVVDFNQPDSFVIAIQGARVSMTTGQLSSLMNGYLLSSPKAQIKDVVITAEGDHLLMKGTMKKGLHIPFQATVAPSITQDNRIRFAVQQMKSAKIPTKGLMDMLGLNMGDLISPKGLKGVSVEKDSFLLDPQTAFPSPQLRGKITSIQVQGQTAVMTFGDGTPKLEAARQAHNFIAVRGGTLRYGREQMYKADITMMDDSPNDPFDFYLREYTRQFAAGTIKPTEDMALRAYLPDYAKLAQHSH